MRYGGFLKWWVSPTNHRFFLLKIIIFGCEMGVPPFKETPIYEMNIDSPPNWKLRVFSLIKFGDTVVDGQKIRRSPVDMVVYAIIYEGFSTIPGGFLPDSESSNSSCTWKNIRFDAGPCGCLMSSHVSASRAWSCLAGWRCCELLGHASSCWSVMMFFDTLQGTITYPTHREKENHGLKSVSWNGIGDHSQEGRCADFISGKLILIESKCLMWMQSMVTTTFKESKGKQQKR